jgi:murein DD-endopeptidase MepM/ murein hydrolase activator NlpD
MTEAINDYILPVNKTCLLSVSSDPETHVGDDKYAIDFEVPLGSDVIAAAPGKVIFVKTDSREGGDDERYENFKYYNHIVLKHANGEYTEYGHLMFDEPSLVKVGQKVKSGDVIAHSGNTGYSEKPHVHFSVFRLNNMADNFEKLPPSKKYFINDAEFGFETIKARLLKY